MGLRVAARRRPHSVPTRARDSGCDDDDLRSLAAHQVQNHAILFPVSGAQGPQGGRHARPSPDRRQLQRGWVRGRHGPASRRFGVLVRDAAAGDIRGRTCRSSPTPARCMHASTRHTRAPCSSQFRGPPTVALVLRRAAHPCLPHAATATCAHACAHRQDRGTRRRLAQRRRRRTRTCKHLAAAGRTAAALAPPHAGARG